MEKKGTCSNCRTIVNFWISDICYYFYMLCFNIAYIVRLCQLSDI